MLSKRSQYHLTRALLKSIFGATGNFREIITSFCDNTSECWQLMGICIWRCFAEKKQFSQEFRIALKVDYSRVWIVCPTSQIIWLNAALIPVLVSFQCGRYRQLPNSGPMVVPVTHIATLSCILFVFLSLCTENILLVRTKNALILWVVSSSK